jgi:hypothetical protein
MLTSHMFLGSEGQGHFFLPSPFPTLVFYRRQMICDLQVIAIAIN